MTSVDERLLRVAEQQHGLLTHHQARAAGLSRSAWRHRLATREWEQVTGRVARRPGSPSTTSQRGLATVLDLGTSAYLSHRSGAALWGVPGFRLEPFELIAMRTRRTPTVLATVHHPRHLPDPFAAVLDGVPVVRPALLLLQLAGLVPAGRLHRVLDWFWTRRLLSGPSVRFELAELMHRGRPGTAALRELLDSLPEDYVPPASGLEGRVRQILGDADLPLMRRQVDLGDERWCGRVDFMAPDLPLVLEVDSETYHAALSSQADDTARQARLEAAGFLVVRATDDETWHRPSVIVERVRAARWRLRAQAA